MDEALFARSASLCGGITEKNLKTEYLKMGGEALREVEALRSAHTINRVLPQSRKIEFILLSVSGIINQGLFKAFISSLLQ